MTEITVALDWTPNTIHSGILLSMRLGYYSVDYVKVNLISPHVDNYSTTPAQLLVSGRADIAFVPKESIISYALNEEGMPRWVLHLWLGLGSCVSQGWQ